MKEKELALALLRKGHTCALVSEKKTLCSDKRGVAPLLLWLDKKEDCKNMFAADKVVGKAAAFLYVLLGVKEVYAFVISERAEEVFLQFGIPYAYETKVAAIRNRTGDGFCPMEQAVLNIDEPTNAWEIIRKRYTELQEKKK